MSMADSLGILHTARFDPLSSGRAIVPTIPIFQPLDVNKYQAISRPEIFQNDFGAERRASLDSSLCSRPRGR